MCAVDAGNANIYVTDEQNGAIRKINITSRVVTTIIGKGCTSSQASCSVGEGCCLPGLSSSPCASSLPGCYIPGSGTSASFASAQSLVLSYSAPCSSAGCLWVTNQWGALSVVDLSASPAAMTLAACIDPGGGSCTSCDYAGCSQYPDTQLLGVALDGASPPNLLVALRNKYAVWQCTPGSSLTAPATCSRDVGQGVGYQYAGDTTTNTLGSWGDESVSSPLSAGLISPWGLAFDATAAALFIADWNVVRSSNFVNGTSPANVVTVAGGQTSGLPGKSTTQYPNNWFPPGPTNKKVPYNGNTDGVGTNSAFSAPNNIVAVPSTRMLYIADSANNCIRSMRY